MSKGNYLRKNYCGCDSPYDCAITFNFGEKEKANTFVRGNGDKTRCRKRFKGKDIEIELPKPKPEVMESVRYTCTKYKDGSEVYHLAFKGKGIESSINLGMEDAKRIAKFINSKKHE